MPDESTDQVSIRAAAAALGKRASFIRELIDTGRLTAHVAGRGKKRTFLLVDLTQARQAVERATRYVPPGLTPEQLEDVRPSKLHPDALKMLRPRREKPARKAS